MYALTSSAWIHQLRGETHLAQVQAEAVIRVATEQEFPHWLALGRVLFGWALALQGQCEAGLAQLQQGLTVYQEHGLKMGMNKFHGLLAEAYESAGQLDAAFGELTNALRAVETLKEYAYEAELYRLTGELTLHSGDEEEAEARFRQALDAANQQQAKSWELRAATNLARLWQSQSKRAEARDLLAPVYNWFTEGFDTKDLQEAKTLMDELY